MNNTYVSKNACGTKNTYSLNKNGIKYSNR